MQSQSSSFPLNKLITLLSAIVLFCIATNWIFGDWLFTFTEELSQGLRSTSNIAALVFLGLSSDIVLPVPSSFISIWAVVSLGTIPAFFIIWLGMTCSCVLGYMLGATPLRSRLFRSEDLQRAQQLMDRYGFFSIVLLRAIPVLAEVSVFIAGVTKMSFARFISVCSLANLGIALLYAFTSQYLLQENSLLLVFAASITIPLLAYALYFFVIQQHSPSVVAAREHVNARNNSQKTGAANSAEYNSPSPHKRDVPICGNALLPSFNVHFQYPLHFSSDVFNTNNPLFHNVLREYVGPEQNIRVLFFIDEGIATGFPSLTQSIRDYCSKYEIDDCSDIQILPGGENIKTQNYINAMQDHMLSVHLDRQSYVCAIGGGAFLDAVGYAATTFHRGIRMVRMPTTVLAQNDAGVGVKNGINAQGIKNLHGTFSVPHAIINDSQLLSSLSDRDFRAGFAEAIKVALIRDADFFHWITSNREALNARDEKATEYLIFRCAQLHLNQICFGGDPFEKGSARPLDYGHWSAHKIESLSHHELNHGEAVAIGMVLDALYAVDQGLLYRTDADQIVDLIKSLGFKLYHPVMHQKNQNGENAVIQGLEEFREHLGGNLSITLLTGLGTAVEVNQIDTKALAHILDYMQVLDCANPKRENLNASK